MGSSSDSERPARTGGGETRRRRWGPAERESALRAWEGRGATQTCTSTGGNGVPCTLIILFERRAVGPGPAAGAAGCCEGPAEGRAEQPTRAPSQQAKQVSKACTACTARTRPAKRGRGRHVAQHQHQHSAQQRRAARQHQALGGGVGPGGQLALYVLRMDGRGVRGRKGVSWVFMHA